MIGLKRIFECYVETSIHVALAVYSLAFITLIKFNLPYNETYLYTVFYGAILGYNFVKLYPVFKRLKFKLFLTYKLTVVISIIALVLFAFYAFKLHVKTFLFLSFFGGVTLLYVLPFSKSLSLRTFPRIKIFIIALVWSSVTVFMPLIELNYNISLDVWIVFVQYFLFVVVLMLPFEIRDLAFDISDLKTLPQLIGVVGTKKLGIILLVIFFLLEWLKNEIFQMNSLITVVVSLFLLLLLGFSTEKQSKYYSSFFVESIPIVWLILLLIF